MEKQNLFLMPRALKMNWLKNEFELVVDYDSDANFDGAQCCTIIGK